VYRGACVTKGTTTLGLYPPPPHVSSDTYDVGLRAVDCLLEKLLLAVFMLVGVMMSLLFATLAGLYNADAPLH
jgi:hypothetical protein